MAMKRRLYLVLLFALFIPVKCEVDIPTPLGIPRGRDEQCGAPRAEVEGRTTMAACAEEEQTR
jgi:hypothetical protein